MAGQHALGACPAPNHRDGSSGGVIEKLNTVERDIIMPAVRSIHHHKEMEEENTPVQELQGARSSTTPFVDEKPLFHSSQRPPGPSVPFVLSEDGERIPYTINRYLRDYQREGVKFIYHNYAKARGCILGDDMGLGKTIQVISFLAAVLHKTGTWEDVEKNVPHFLLSQKSSEKSKVKKVFLIVAPLSVLYNWKDELDTWGHFRTVIMHGVRKEEELARMKRGRCEIALTTYETLRLSLDQFNSIDWAAVIVDEAHKIKNCKSQITQAMKEMRCKVRVGLTGTILQNNLEELWCVMDWAIPGCLGSLGHFKNNFADPIEHGQKHSVTKRTLAVGRKAVQALAKRLSRWFLRRTKALISDQLPKKDDRVVYCSLTDFQQTVYRAVLDTEDVTLLLRSSERCSCGSGRSRKTCCFQTNSSGVRVRDLYFSYLAILRKVANHVALLQSKGGTSKKQEKYVKAICERVFQTCPDFVERCKQAAFEAMSDPMYSGKMRVLQRLLNHFMRKKDKVLLFSLSTKLLDVLESYCMAEGMEYRRLDGNTKPKERVKIVKEFNSTQDINICLVSTMAGGLGLNFVGANIVVLFDPTWNPANDLQAIDRAYRIGQCRDVTVFRLISLGTVEEVIYLRQVYKQQLQASVVGRENARRYFEAVQGTEGQAGELFGIRNLFRLQTEGTCLTHRILEREGRVEVGVMTASTQAWEQRKRESDAEGVAGEASGPGKGTSGVLDFSSASEGEEASSSRTKAPAPGAVEEHGPSSSSSPAPLSLLQHGLSSLLQGPAGESSPSEDHSGDSSDSDESSEGPASRAPKAAERDGPPRTDWAVASGPEGGVARKTARRKSAPAVTAREMDCHAEESEDIGLRLERAPQKHVPSRTSGYSEQRLARQTRKHRRAPADATERFTSSEDEAPVRKAKPVSGVLAPPQREASACGQPSSRAATDHRSVQFTCVKSRIGQQTPVSEKGWPGKGANVGTIDTLLGGLQEVSYTHSNQRVVGASRAENRISRAAVRDVFERNKYSQIPANHLPDSTETLSGHTQLSGPWHTQRGEEGQAWMVGTVPHLEQPVTHTVRTTHHTPHATVIVGETPSAIRRKQLQDMACFFGADSALEFAEDVLRSSSELRLGRLRQFYSQQHPELRDIMKQAFPKPETATPRPPASPASSNTPRQRPTAKRTHPRSLLKTHAEVQIPEVTDESRGPKKRRSFSPGTSGDHRHPCTELRDHVGKEAPSTESGHDQAKASDSHPRHEHQPQVNPRTPPAWECSEPRPPLVKPSLQTPRGSGRSSPGSRAEQGETSAPRSMMSLITDLIGDTSVLDELLRPKARAGDPAGPSAASTPPQHAQRAKTRSKDVWDILNEGNEESINKLTDMSQVEKICMNANISAKSKSDGRSESSSPQLWKKNEKFLWKL